METAHIRIVYDGDALQDGSMDVRDLAPALLALSDLIDESNKLLNPKPGTVQIRARRDIETGSFDIGITIIQSWPSQVLQFFAGEQMSGLSNLLGILGLSAATLATPLLLAIKWLRGRKVTSVEVIGDDDVRITVEGDQIVVTKPVASLLADRRIRSLIAMLLDPLRREGIDRFDVSGPGEPVVTSIVKAELPSFDPPDPIGSPPEILTSTEYEQAYTVVSPSFREGNKWRLYDGQSTVSATIEDNDFLARVDNHDEAFVKDDVIVCKVRQMQNVGPDGLRSTLSILKVVEHRHAPRQTVLPLTLKATNDPGSNDPQK
jgi:hypothetical protein